MRTKIVVSCNDDRANFGSAGSGGYWIANGVLHEWVHHLDFRLKVQAAGDVQRVHCSGDETIIDSHMPEAVGERLAAMGHDIVVAEQAPESLNFARVVSVGVDPATGLRHSGSGPACSTATAGQ